MSHIRIVVLHLSIKVKVKLDKVKVPQKLKPKELKRPLEAGCNVDHKLHPLQCHEWMGIRQSLFLDYVTSARSAKIWRNIGFLYFGVETKNFCYPFFKNIFIYIYIFILIIQTMEATA